LLAARARTRTHCTAVRCGADHMPRADAQPVSQANYRFPAWWFIFMVVQNFPNMILEGCLWGVIWCVPPVTRGSMFDGEMSMHALLERMEPATRACCELTLLFACLRAGHRQSEIFLVRLRRPECWGCLHPFRPPHRYSHRWLATWPTKCRRVAAGISGGGDPSCCLAI
jgi:hypothetical protein